MPWEKIAESAPAFAALCVIVISSGGLIWKIVSKFMTAQDKYMEQMSEISGTCHKSHKEVADETASAVRENTKALGKLSESQTEIRVVLQETATLLKAANGRLQR
jgi:hypothetical protein